MYYIIYGLHVSLWNEALTCEAFAATRSHHKQTKNIFTCTSELSVSSKAKDKNAVKQDSVFHVHRYDTHTLTDAYTHTHTCPGKGLLWPFTHFSGKCGNPVRKFENNKQQQSFLRSASCEWHNQLGSACNVFVFFFSDRCENTDTGARPVHAKCLCSQSCLGMDVITAGEYVCVCICACCLAPGNCIGWNLIILP